MTLINKQTNTLAKTNKQHQATTAAAQTSKTRSLTNNDKQQKQEQTH